MNAKIKTTHAVNANENGHTLTPYVSQDGEIWLASEGNGCGDDVMLEDVEGLTEEEICERWGGIDLDALRADAEEIRAAGDADNADWPATFDVVASWSVDGQIGRHDNMHDELEPYLGSLIDAISASVGGRWHYDAANGTISQC